VKPAQSRYAVPGWGVGEVWWADGILLAHDFRFANGHVQVPDPGSDPSAGQGGLVHEGPVRELVRRFGAFLEGEDVSFEDVALDLEWATPLQRAIVAALRRVPRGDVVSYGELAALAGRPRAPRAAGAVCSTNRFAFVVPCHRVVSAHGIGGYGEAGVEVKRRLLALEGVRL
jgi:methylated-DNA-[protein]-cysteine S-methyltransferase